MLGSLLPRLPEQVAADVEAAWSYQARTFCHSDLPSLEPAPKPPAQKCKFFGQCLCSGGGRLLSQFEDRVVSACKRHFPRATAGEPSAKRARAALKDGDVVLCLEGSAGRLWFHVAATNLTTWAMVLLPLAELTDAAAVAAAQPDVALAVVPGSRWRPSFAAFGELDLADSWKGSFYTLVGSSEDTLPALHPHLLRVRRTTDQDVLWSGSLAVARPRALAPMGPGGRHSVSVAQALSGAFRHKLGRPAPGKGEKGMSSASGTKIIPADPQLRGPGVWRSRLAVPGPKFGRTDPAF